MDESCHCSIFIGQLSYLKSGLQNANKQYQKINSFQWFLLELVFVCFDEGSTRGKNTGDWERGNNFLTGTFWVTILDVIGKKPGSKPSTVPNFLLRVPLCLSLS